VNFTKAKRQNVSLIAGIAGPSGGGKTYSALRFATGLAAGAPIAAIDTERGRMLHYADEFDFEYAELDAPFSPKRYGEAIEAALKLNPGVVIVDSFSHEWAGEGGVLDMQQAEYERMGSRDAVKVASWIKPKAEHKLLINHVLLRLPCHLILCLRAEDKIEIVKNETTGKTEVIAKKTLAGHEGWIPVTGKEVPYELTVSLVVTPDNPGVPKPIKLEEHHRSLVFTDVPLDEATGERLAAWAKGSAPNPSGADTTGASPSPREPGKGSAPSDAPELLTDEQRDQLDELVRGYSLAQLTATLAKDRGIAADQVTVDDWPTLREKLTAAEADSWIERMSKKTPAGATA